LCDCLIARLPAEDAIGEGNVEWQRRVGVLLEVRFAESLEGGQDLGRGNVGHSVSEVCQSLFRGALSGRQARLDHQEVSQLVD
jgi:hypothetical protein